VEAELRQASHVQSRPRLHLNFAEVYRAGIAAMREAMAVDGGTEVMEAARALIDRLEVHPPAEAGGTARLELVGHLSATLRAGGFDGGVGARNGKSPSVLVGGLSLFVSTSSGNAGTRNRRPQYVEVAI
jgi:hypothetical protein